MFYVGLVVTTKQKSRVDSWKIKKVGDWAYCHGKLPI